MLGGVAVALELAQPGNLLVLGRCDARPVLGVPGCARSLQPSGFDWVLQRLFAGLEVRREDITRMGAGGLLARVGSRRPTTLSSDAEE